mmetsp:Transcript_17064/g.21464  ORF Transcript_17064/g.21464 Transcript_17064/m.21464 type:complete len:190 (+) Transcript_17064:22-591(+)
MGSLCCTVYNTADDLPAELLETNKTIHGVVLHVTDGDTLRLRQKNCFSNVNYIGELQDFTIVVRFAGIDTPETAKFGKEGQPFGEEAKKFVKETLLGQDVSVQLLSRDQYHRVVGMVTYGPWYAKKNISSELLKRGLAYIYRQGGAEYGDKLEDFEKFEKEAKEKKMGVWSGDFETPAEYKKRVRAKAK